MELCIQTLSLKVIWLKLLAQTSESHSLNVKVIKKMSHDLSYRGHKLTVSWQKDSFSFDISMQSGFWFESLNSTASATAPSTRQENEIDMPPHDLHGKQSTARKFIQCEQKSWLKFCADSKGLSLCSLFLPQVYFPLQQHLVSFIWGFYNESAHSCGSNILYKSRTNCLHKETFDPWLVELLKYTVILNTQPPSGPSLDR